MRMRCSTGRSSCDSPTQPLQVRSRCRCRHSSSSVIQELEIRTEVPDRQIDEDLAVFEVSSGTRAVVSGQTGIPREEAVMIPWGIERIRLISGMKTPSG